MFFDFKGLLQPFKFENWRFGELENSIFDVTNRAYINFKDSNGFSFLSPDLFLFCSRFSTFPQHRLAFKNIWRMKMKNKNAFFENLQTLQHYSIQIRKKANAVIIIQIPRIWRNFANCNIPDFSQKLHMKNKNYIFFKSVP